MKKPTPILLTLLFYVVAICQDPLITMTTTQAIGPESNFSSKASSENTFIKVDIGNDNFPNQTIVTSETSSKGILVGSQIIKIYSPGIKYIDCYDNQLTTLDVTKNSFDKPWLQKQPTYLYLLA